jgi:hypothetical protein
MHEIRIMKPVKIIFKRGKNNNKIIGEINLIKVHCVHVWNYHNEAICIINICLLKYFLKEKKKSRFLPPFQS